MSVDVVRDRQLAEQLGVRFCFSGDHVLDPHSVEELKTACAILLSDQDAWMFFPSLARENVTPVKTAAMRVLNTRRTPPGIALRPKW